MPAVLESDWTGATEGLRRRIIAPRITTTTTIQSTVFDDVDIDFVCWVNNFIRYLL